MAIYTRGGDDGHTSLVGGERISKASARVEAYGTVDEANSSVGLARCCASGDLLPEILRFIQHRLFNCSSLLAYPPESTVRPSVTITKHDIAFLEQAIDTMIARSPAVKGFVLEAGCECASRIHMARSITRRAERRIVALAEEEPVPDEVLTFVNRTSDVLHAAAIYANALSDSAEEPWDPTAQPPELTR